MQTKVGRPGKSQRFCNSCKKPSSPKDGDWFHSVEAGGPQIFLCRDCQRKQPTTSDRRAIPIR